MNNGYIKTRMYKDWCKARGIDFAKYMAQFPMVRYRMYIEPSRPILKPAFWRKVKDFICRMLPTLKTQG